MVSRVRCNDSLSLGRDVVHSAKQKEIMQPASCNALRCSESQRNRVLAYPRNAFALFSLAIARIKALCDNKE